MDRRRRVAAVEAFANHRGLGVGRGGAPRRRWGAPLLVVTHHHRVPHHHRRFLEQQRRALGQQRRVLEQQLALPFHPRSGVTPHADDTTGNGTDADADADDASGRRQPEDLHAGGDRPGQQVAVHEEEGQRDQAGGLGAPGQAGQARSHQALYDQRGLGGTGPSSPRAGP
jgi:hypothetical protein